MGYIEYFFLNRIKLILIPILVTFPNFAFSQSSIKFYQRIEPQLLLGFGQLINNQYHHLATNRISLETKISYTVDLNDNFIFKPFIGYSSISTSTSSSSANHDSYQSFTAGSAIDLKKQQWKFGLGVKGNKLLKVIYSIDGNKSKADLSAFFYKIFYQGGLNCCFSFSHFNILAEVWISFTEIQSSFFEPLRINEYLIGIGYHI